MKWIQTFKSFLSESAINEIGDSQPIDWRLAGTNKEMGSIEYTYQFDTAMETYDVNISHYTSEYSKADNIVVDFSIGGDTSIITNSGAALSVLSTVIDIVKDFIRNHPKVTEVGFVPSKANETDSRREKIYMYYIRKNFPGAKITKQELTLGQSTVSSIDVIL